jgi:protein-disulfide isomerase
VGGAHSGIFTTPTFFINGVHFRGTPDLATLTAAIAGASSAS